MGKLPRMGAAIMPRKCSFCTFFEAYLTKGLNVATLADMSTYCTIDPENRREISILVSLNDVDNECPFWEEHDET